MSDKHTLMLSVDLQARTTFLIAYCKMLISLLFASVFQDKQGIPWWLGLSYKGIFQYDHQDKVKPRKVSCLCTTFSLFPTVFFIYWVLIMYLDITLTMLFLVEPLSPGMFYFLSCFSFCHTINAPFSCSMRSLGDLSKPFLTHPSPKWCLWPWSLTFCLVSLSINSIPNDYQDVHTHAHWCTIGH